MPAEKEVERMFNMIKEIHRSLLEAQKYSKEIGILSTEKSIEACVAIVQRILEGLGPSTGVQKVAFEY